MAAGNQRERELTRRVEIALARVVGGDESGYDDLIPLLYDELHLIALYFMRQERAGHTLQATALVNEACLRLMRLTHVQWKDRSHFLQVAARAMRRVLVDHARAHQCAKRGDGADLLPLDAVESAGAALFGYPDLRILELNDAIDKLAVVQERKARVVELLYFGGLTRSEAAHVLGVTRRTVDRDWLFARLWLIRELDGVA